MFPLFSLLACFPEFPANRAIDFVENPAHDYDGDGIYDDEDCDDGNPLIRLESIWYKDDDGDGFGLESQSDWACENEKPDGYVAQMGDCDDFDPQINPAASEICDGVDNDCNTLIDDYTGPDAPRWYKDDDGDGFGQYDEYVQSCTMTDGYVDNFLDCDDSDPEIRPDGEELCDGVDNNCNGGIDENTARDAPLWYADSDLDGFGSKAVSQPSCSQPDGYVADDRDCNDQNDQQRFGMYNNGDNDNINFSYHSRQHQQHKSRNEVENEVCPSIHHFVGLVNSLTEHDVIV